MASPLIAAAALALVTTAATSASPGAAQAFWKRSQVSMCADATSVQELARHRCEELNAYADPGWPALGVGTAVYGLPPALPRHGHGRSSRIPTRRLG